MSLNERIKKRREELGYSQDELAQKLGYKSRSTIAKIESGENQINYKKIQEFAVALDTTINALLDLDETSENIIDKEKPINPLENRPMTKRELSQYDKVMNEAVLMFNDEEVPEEDKERLMMTLNDMFWKSKQINKEKYAKSHNKDNEN